MSKQICLAINSLLFSSMEKIVQNLSQMFIEIVLIFLYTTKFEIMTIVSNFISIPSLLLFNLKEKLLNVSLSAVERIPVRRSHVPPNFKFAFSILIRALCCPNRIYYSFMAVLKFLSIA